MKVSARKIWLVLAIAVALPLAFSGCQKKGNTGLCKNDVDCRIDASGKEINGVCVMGKCEECAEDSHCTELKQCVNNRCLSACQADADCGANSHCENNYCMSNCTADDACPSNHSCLSGRCVAQNSENDPNAWAQGECAGLEKVYFDFDRYDVKPEQRQHADKLSRCLETNPSYKVTIEGHTDDRGTESYNIALGDRRASAVKTYLKNKGIAANRIDTVSFGAQRPANNERNEYAWQQNRRAAFILGR